MSTEDAAPGSPWIPVGALAEAFAPHGNVAPPSAALAGRTLTLELDDGRSVEHRFASDRLLVRTASAGEGAGGQREEAYTATAVREGIYLVDFVARQERATSVSLVLDLPRGIVTEVVGRLPGELEASRPLLDLAEQGGELTGVEVTFRSGAIDAPLTAETPRHAPTARLVGRRVEYTYSPTERYEHIYLNERFYTWHCLLGAEAGLADTDRCHAYELADELYLFVWREKIVPTLGVVVLDHERLRSSGKIFGYLGGDFGTVANFPVGSTARIVNVSSLT